MNKTIIPINYIERKPNSEKYQIVDKGVTVEFLSGLINDPEWTVERICQNYNLTPAEVYSAWAFYYDHQPEIDARIEATRRDAKQHMDESRQQRQALIDRLDGEG